MGISRKTVHVPVDVEEDFERTFHTTTACPASDSPTTEMLRSRARREGLTECARCFEHRMRAVEYTPSVDIGLTAESGELCSVSGFSDFVVR